MHFQENLTQKIEGLVLRTNDPLIGGIPLFCKYIGLPMVTVNINVRDMLPGI